MQILPADPPFNLIVEVLKITYFLVIIRGFCWFYMLTLHAFYVVNYAFQFRKLVFAKNVKLDSFIMQLQWRKLLLRHDLKINFGIFQ